MKFSLAVVIRRIMIDPGENDIGRADRPLSVKRSSRSIDATSLDGSSIQLCATRLPRFLAAYRSLLEPPPKTSRSRSGDDEYSASRPQPGARENSSRVLGSHDGTPATLRRQATSRGKGTARLGTAAKNLGPIECPPRHTNRFRDR